MALIAVGRAYERTRDFLSEELWHAAPEPNSLAGRALSALQFVAMIAEGFIRDHGEHVFGFDRDGEEVEVASLPEDPFARQPRGQQAGAGLELPWSKRG